MEKLSRILTLSLIFFAWMESITATDCVRYNNSGHYGDEDDPARAEKPKTDAKPTWTLNIHFTSWTLDGTFRVDDFYLVTNHEFKDNKTVLNGDNNVTVVLQVDIDSNIEETLLVDLILDDFPFVLNAATIEFHGLRQKSRPKRDAVLPVIFSPAAADPYVKNVRGICYFHRCEIHPFWPEYESEYNLFVHCDRVRPYLSEVVLYSPDVKERFLESLQPHSDCE